MASSDKPDFIEIDQKDAPLKLTEGGLPVAGELCGEVSTAESDVPASSAPASGTPDAAALHTVSPRQSAISSQSVPQKTGSTRPELNDSTIALTKKSMPPGKPMRKLPGGPVVFIGLLAVVCMFGNQIDEMRNRTLADLAKRFAIGDRGYVETVGDLGSSLVRHGNLDGAEGAYEKALLELKAAGQDFGTRGAFLKLKLVEVAFAKANREVQTGRLSRKRSERQKHFDKSWQYKADAVPLAKQALEMLSKDRSGKPSELPFLLWYAGDNFEDWYDYGTAIKLNEEALNLWGRGSPNRRSWVNTQLGYEYLRMGESAKAEDVVKQALTFGLRQGTTRQNAWRYSLLARSQVDLKKYAEAESNLSRAVEMWQELEKTGMEGNVDLDLARTYTDKGRIKAALGNSSEALSWFKKSEKILREYSNRTYDTMRNQLEMANLYRDTGQYPKAKELYDDIMSRMEGADDPVDRKLVTQDIQLLRRLSGGN